MPRVTDEAPELNDVQGLVIRGYKRFGGARYLLGEITSPPAASAWLGRVPIATAVPDGADEALNLALTAAGLAKLDLPADVLAQFSHEFVEGMTTPHRQRILGDVDESSPERWEWGSPGATRSTSSCWCSDSPTPRRTPQRRAMRRRCRRTGCV